jgi:hypothetical protein
MDEQHAARVAMQMARRIELIEQQITELRGTVAEIRAANPVTAPPVREMITSVLQYAVPKGLSRSEIIRAIYRDYGVVVLDNTLTGTLSRMHVAQFVRRTGQTWFLR